MDDMTLKYNTKAVLRIVEDNKAAHILAYTEALENYRVAAIAELERMIERLKAGKRIGQAIRTREPQSHEEDYDEALELLRHCSSDEIELTSRSANQLLRDKWGWTRDFYETSRSYGG